MNDFKLCYGCMRKRTQDEKYCPSCGFNYEVYMSKKKPGTLNPGTIIDDRYIIGIVLGQGGFGITYLGYDKNLEIPVAVKEYYPKDSVSRETENMETNGCKVSVIGDVNEYKAGLERFLNEARTLAQFNKLEGIVTVSAYIEENNTGYIIMDYLPGMSLKKIIEGQKEPMAEKEVIRLLKPVMKALEEVHKHGLIHRDISPDNLIMNDDGCLTLIDFGAARQVTQQNQHDLTVILKRGYAPLEQCIKSGEQGPWTDVYALAATIYYMITHAVPEQAIERVRDDPVYTLYDLGMPVSKAFSDAVAIGMEVDYHDRFQSMEAFEAALTGETNITDQKQNSRKTEPNFLNTSGKSGKYTPANAVDNSKRRSVYGERFSHWSDGHIPPAPVRPENEDNGSDRKLMLAVTVVIGIAAVVLIGTALFLLLS